MSVSSYYRKIKRETRSGQATLHALDLDLFFNIASQFLKTINRKVNGDRKPPDKFQSLFFWI